MADFPFTVNESFSLLPSLWCTISVDLNISKIDFWLLKESCLEILTKKEIISNKFIIGVKSIIEKNIVLNQFPQLNNFLDIYVENERITKSWKLYNLDIKVPCPVILYLEKTFQKTWKELQNE